MAGTTGLEPATSDVTGRRSNQLNYVPAFTARTCRIARFLAFATCWFVLLDRTPVATGFKRRDVTIPRGWRALASISQAPHRNNV